jgi:hypothetical protein
MSLVFGTAATLAFFAAGFPEAPSRATPKTMLKMMVRLTGPNIKPGSHAALPKTIYVAGPHYARIENPPDARQQQQKVTIIAEPDAYSFNLIDKRGTHAIDQGGEGDLHLPVILPFDPKHKLGELDSLEFGSELDFFIEGGAAKSSGPIINAQSTDAYEIKSDTGSAKLVLRSGSKTPVLLSWTSEDGTYTYEYITYQELPFDKNLFSKPAGISFTELPPNDSEK